VVGGTGGPALARERAAADALRRCRCIRERILHVHGGGGRRCEQHSDAEARAPHETTTGTSTEGHRSSAPGGLVAVTRAPADACPSPWRPTGRRHRDRTSTGIVYALSDGSHTRAHRPRTCAARVSHGGRRRPPAGLRGLGHDRAVARPLLGGPSCM